MLNRVDLSSRRNDINDGMVLTDDGRAFQGRVAAAGKARSPSVDRRVGGTTSVGAAPDRRHRRLSTSVVGWIVSARYGGAVPFKQRYVRTVVSDRCGGSYSCSVYIL